MDVVPTGCAQVVAEPEVQLDIGKKRELPPPDHPLRNPRHCDATKGERKRVSTIYMDPSSMSCV